MNRGSVIFIDVREADEFASGHAEGAVNLPLSELVGGKADTGDLPRDKKLVVYCNFGNRSGAAMDILGKLGFNDLENGINAEEVEQRYL